MYPEYPLHPAEQPPVNSTIPTGGGFRITEPNKVGAWDFRSFTVAPDQIVVNQGDKVTLHFIGVQGVHHLITVEGVGSLYTSERTNPHSIIRSKQPRDHKLLLSHTHAKHDWPNIGAT